MDREKEWEQYRAPEMLENLALEIKILEELAGQYKESSEFKEDLMLEIESLKGALRFEKERKF